MAVKSPLVILLLFLGGTALVQAQLGVGAAGGGAAVRVPDADVRLQMAIASREYPVNPGDRYQLTVSTGGAETVSVVTVENDYSLNLRALGVVDGRGLTSSQLRQEVQRLSQEAYPRSQSSFDLVSAGVFQVSVRGAVAEPTSVTAWGLTRLGEVVLPQAESYTSIRRVGALYADGTREVHDVAKARAGVDGARDPLLRPDMEIVFPVVEASVSVQGEVLRPGDYELLEGETPADLVALAGGFSPSADPERIMVQRHSSENSQVSTFALRAAEGVALEDGDAISVGAVSAPQRVVFVEGAVLPSPDAPELREDSDDVELAYQRFRRPVVSGNTLLDVLRPLEDRIAPYADLQNTVVIRSNGRESHQIDAAALLYGGGEDGNLALEPFDTVFIPSRRVSVVVTGAVANPGRVIFVPGQGGDFYIRQAGGVNPELSSDGEYTVYDQVGNQRPADERVSAGDTIDVHRNNFVYQFNRSFPVVISSVGLITSIVTLFAVLAD